MSDESEKNVVTIEIDYTHFTKPDGWMKILQIICGIIAIACCAPALFPTQVYFLIVMIWQLIFSVLLSLLHLKKVEFNDYGKLVEFVYTSGTSLFCFAAWIAQFSDLDGFVDKILYRWDAQIAAASFGLIYNLALVTSAGLQFRAAYVAFKDIRGDFKPNV